MQQVNKQFSLWKLELNYCSAFCLPMIEKGKLLAAKSMKKEMQFASRPNYVSALHFSVICPESVSVGPDDK